MLGELDTPIPLVYKEAVAIAHGRKSGLAMIRDKRG